MIITRPIFIFHQRYPRRAKLFLNDTHTSVTLQIKRLSAEKGLITQNNCHGRLVVHHFHDHLVSASGRNTEMAKIQKYSLENHWGRQKTAETVLLCQKTRVSNIICFTWCWEWKNVFVDHKDGRFFHTFTFTLSSTKVKNINSSEQWNKLSVIYCQPSKQEGKTMRQWFWFCEHWWKNGIICGCLKV